MKRIGIGLAVVAVAVVALFGMLAPAPVALSIVAGSENKDLEPLIQDWAQQNNIDLTMSYQGSVDISRILEQGKLTTHCFRDSK